MSASLTPDSSSSVSIDPPSLHQNTLVPGAKDWFSSVLANFLFKYIVSNYIDQYTAAVVCSARPGQAQPKG
ncbi:Aspartokinase [Pleurotus ostreatus]|nr:Aspartokinase [Pleurotus ostreatus]